MVKKVSFRAGEFERQRRLFRKEQQLPPETQCVLLFYLPLKRAWARTFLDWRKLLRTLAPRLPKLGSGHIQGLHDRIQHLPGL